MLRYVGNLFTKPCDEADSASSSMDETIASPETLPHPQNGLILLATTCLNLFVDFDIPASRTDNTSTTLRRAKRDNFTAVFVDMGNFPDGGIGFRIVRRLSDAQIKAPIFLMTSEVRKADLFYAKRNGAEGVILRTPESVRIAYYAALKSEKVDAIAQEVRDAILNSAELSISLPKQLPSFTSQISSASRDSNAFQHPVSTIDRG